MGYIGNKNSVALYDSYTKAQADGIFQTPFAEIDVTGGATVNDLNGLYLLTGTLTSNVTFVVQDAQRQFTVVNSTSGSFTVTVKTAAGTGVVVPQGQARILRSDGANVVDGVQVNADQVFYDDSISGLGVSTSQGAFDEIAGSQFGREQGRKDVLASRSGGVTYTNPSSRPMELQVVFEFPSGSQFLDLATEDIFGNPITLRLGVTPGLTNARINASVMISGGATYTLLPQSTPTILEWTEFTV